jgi:hypothetical protein
MASSPGAVREALVARARRFARHGRWREVLHNGPKLTAWVLGATLGFHLLYVLPWTHEFGEDILSEDSIVEDITAVALFAAATLGVFLALRARRAGRPARVWGFYALVAAAVFVIGMEEISWGQWIFFWNSPETFKEINSQGETNLHNIGPLQGHSEWFRFAFVAAALVGVVCNSRAALREIATPRSLTGPLIVILTYVSVDLLDDFFPRVPWIVTTFSSMSEWTEMLIALAAFAYVVLKREELVGTPLASP